MSIAGKIICLIGRHAWIKNVDDRSLAGEHRCKYCNKLGWKIQRPKARPRPKVPKK